MQNILTVLTKNFFKYVILLSSSPINCDNQACVNNVDNWYWVGSLNKKTPLAAQDIDGIVTIMSINNQIPLPRFNKGAKYRWDDASSTSICPVVCEFDASLTPDSKLLLHGVFFQIFKFWSFERL